MVTLHGEGYTERDVGDKLRCFKTHVHNAVVKVNADGTFYRRRSGRPRKTTPREDRSIIHIVIRSPKSSCKTLCAILSLKGTAIPSSTVSRRLSNKCGLKYNRPA